MSSKKQSTIRSVIRFSSSTFNCSEVKDYFINARCFGDDVAALITNEWRKRGFETRDPFQEDWGWTAQLNHNTIWYYLNIGIFQDDLAPKSPPCTWLISIEKCCGFWQSPFGNEKKNIQQDFLVALHKMLAECQDFKDLRWFNESEDCGPAALGSAAPWTIDGEDFDVVAFCIYSESKTLGSNPGQFLLSCSLWRRKFQLRLGSSW